MSDHVGYRLQVDFAFRRAEQTRKRRAKESDEVKAKLREKAKLRMQKLRASRKKKKGVKSTRKAWTKLVKRRMKYRIKTTIPANLKRFNKFAESLKPWEEGFDEEEKRKELVGAVRKAIAEDDLEAAYDHLTDLKERTVWPWQRGRLETEYLEYFVVMVADTCARLPKLCVRVTLGVRKRRDILLLF